MTYGILTTAFVQVKEKTQRHQQRARLLSKLQKLCAAVQVVEGLYDDVRVSAEQAEGLGLKTYVIKSNRPDRNRVSAWLVYGENGGAVQRMGVILRNNTKQRPWTGRVMKIITKMVGNPAIQNFVQKSVLGWLGAARKRDCE